MRIDESGYPFEPHANRFGTIEMVLPADPIADGDRNAALIVDYLEAVDVGEIIANVHGRSARERRLFEECLDGPALVESTRLDLEHHVARLHVVIGAEQCCDGRYFLTQLRFELRCHAEVDGHGSALVLEQR